MTDKSDMDLTSEEQAMLEDDKAVVLDETDEEAEINAEAEKAAKGKEQPRGDDGKFKSAKAEEEREDADRADAERSQADEDQDAAEEKDDGMVPIQAVYRERDKAAGYREELESLRREIAALKQPQQQQTAPEKPADAPDPIVDPQGFREWQAAEMAKAQKPFNDFRQNIETQHKQQQQLSALYNFANQDEARFRQEHPDKDYNAALTYARSIKRKEMAAMGIQGQEADQMLNQIEMGVAAQAYQRGISPAAYIWNYARTHGFNAAPAEDAPDEGAKIARLADVQKKTASGAGRSGAPREDELSAERLFRMSDSEFDKLSEDDFRRAMGG